LRLLGGGFPPLEREKTETSLKKKEKTPNAKKPNLPPFLHTQQFLGEKEKNVQRVPSTSTKTPAKKEKGV